MAPDYHSKQVYLMSPKTLYLSAKQLKPCQTPVEKAKGYVFRGQIDYLKKKEKVVYLKGHQGKDTLTSVAT